MTRYNSNYYNRKLIESFKTTVLKQLLEQNEKLGDHSQTKVQRVSQQDATVTPWQVTGTAYSGGRSMTAEFEKEFEKAYKNQQDVYGSLSSDAQREINLRYGNPNDPDYAKGEYQMSYGTFDNPRTGGMAFSLGMYPDDARRLNVDPKPPRVVIDTRAPSRNDERIVPHEQTHIQQGIAATNQSNQDYEDDKKNQYQNRKIEHGAESNARVLITRTQKARESGKPEEALKPLSDEEVDQSLKSASDMGYKADLTSLRSEIQDEIKKYLKHKVVKGDSNQPKVGTLPNTETRMA